MKKVIIIGGGIIGTCCAYYLSESGFEVTILEKQTIDKGCSHGNAGMVVPSHVIPLAAPGMISKGIRWMFNPESPFYIHPRASKELFRWGWLFYKASNDGHVKRSIPALRDISLLSKKLYRKLSSDGKFSFAFEEKGLLMLYKTEAVGVEEKHVAAIANKAGLQAEVLSVEEVKAMDSDTAFDIRGGVYYPGDAHLSPQALMTGMHRYLKEKGVKVFENNKVHKFDLAGGKLETNQGAFVFDELVIATGSWTGELMAELGVKLPMQSGKGYSITLDAPIKKPKYPMILCEAKVAVTPMGDQLRFGGTMEVSELNHTIDKRRVKGILKSIPQFMPEYKIEMPPTEKIWCGLRPCSPDGLPYIGRWPGKENLTIASGHAMMGLSLGPATGLMINAILLGKESRISLHPFRPERFS